MIIFSGIISDDIQDRTFKKREKYISRIAWMYSLVLIILSSFFWVLFKWELKELLVLVLLLIGVLLFTQICKPRKKLSFRWEYHITIDEEKVIVVSPLWSKPLEKPIKKIKKVLDEGDCYYLIFADINNCIICQKNLLMKGTIEDFENLFKQKIIKS